MALRLYSPFTSEKGNDWILFVYDSSFSGAATECDLGTPGFELEYHGGPDAFSPLMPSTLTMHLMVKGSNESSLVADLVDFQEGRFVMALYSDPTGTNALHWIGLLTPESIKIPDEAPPYAVELKAICGLATLSKVDFDSSIGPLSTTNALSHMLAALAAIPELRNYYATSAPYLNSPEDITPSTGTFLEDVYFGAETYDPQLGLRTVGTAEDMLTQICLMLNARLFMWRGSWMLCPVVGFMNVGSLISGILRFDKDGTQLADGQSYPDVSIDQVNRHRLGGEFYFLPAVRKVSRDINYFGNSPFAGSRQLYPNQFRAVGHTNTGEPTSLAISGSQPVNLATDQTIKVRGFCFVRCPWQFTNVPSYDPQSRLSRWRIELTVKVGSKYLSRVIAHDYSVTEFSADLLYQPPGTGTNAATIFNLQEPAIYTWTTNSASRVHFWTDVLINGHADYQGDPVSQQVDFEFITPPIGTAEAATVDVTMRVRGYNGEASFGNDDAYLVGSGLYDNAGTYMLGDLAAYIGDGTDNGDVLTFSATLNNGATEELEIPVGFYAEGPSDDVLNFNSAALTDSGGANITGFTSDLTTTTTALATLLCIDRLHHLGEQQELYLGTFQSSALLDPFRRLTFDSKKWMVLSLAMQGDSDLYQLELIKVKTLGTLDPDPETPSRTTTELIHSPSGSIGSVIESVNRGRRDLMNITEEIATDVAAVNRTTDASGGASSILLQYLGDVKISSPTTGQVLEYNSAAGRWANVTPGVQYHGRYDAEAATERSGATGNVEIYYTARPDGDGYAESETSDSGVTDTINRTLYYSTKHLADPDTAGDWTEYTTQPADNATFATAKAALLAGLNETNATAETRGTLPLSLKMVRTTTPSTTLLLDTYSAAAAWSVRKISSSYTGYCMKVRRASDDAEADIGFNSNGVVDSAAIATHCGASAGYCSVWYDQAGGAYNLAQTTTTNQPQIYDGTSVLTVNGKPALDFDGSADHMKTSGSITINSQRCDFGVITPTLGSINMVVLTTDNVLSFGNRKAQNIRIQSTGQVRTIGFTTSVAAVSLTGSTSIGSGTQSLISTQLSGTTLEVFLDGSSDGTTTQSSQITGTSPVGVGVGYNLGGPFDGRIQELIMYQSDMDTDRATITSEINTYFSIYTP